MKRILFAGSAYFSIPVLHALAQIKAVCAVLTAPDSRAGRGLAVQKNPVARYAYDAGLPLLQPEFLRASAREAAAAHKPDGMICAAYGKIFGPKFLALFSSGAVNVHPSLLPRFRGPAPVPAAILADDEYTGVTLQTMALDMDCGHIIAQTRTAVGVHETCGSLMRRLAEDGVAQVMHMLADFDQLYARAVPQDHDKATYCTKINSSFGFIAPFDTAARALRIARAFSPAGIKMRYGSGSPAVLKMWNLRVVNETSCEHPFGTVLGCNDEGLLIQTACGILACRELQLPGRKRLQWKDFVSGERAILHSRLW